MLIVKIRLTDIDFVTSLIEKIQIKKGKWYKVPFVGYMTKKPA